MVLPIYSGCLHPSALFFYFVFINFTFYIFVFKLICNKFDCIEYISKEVQSVKNASIDCKLQIKGND